PPGGGQYHRGLDIADDDIGQDLPHHHLKRAYWHGEQVLHRAALRLAGHGERCENDHGEGEDDADKSRYDVEFGPSFRIVASMNDNIEGQGRGDDICERAFEIAVQYA